MPSAARTHIVLVPGFAGFDALGQLEYYAGVTPQLRRWCATHGRADVSLHYFDNFPTAGVAMRARRLARYVAKRIARGSFAPGDRLALVGHSTGGLDIRQFVADVDGAREPWRLDGVGEDAVAVEPGAMRDLLRAGRIVFLSVPQYGTNIADWVRARWIERRLVLGGLEVSVATARRPLLDAIPQSVAAVGTALTRSSAAAALEDTLREVDTGTARTPDDMAAARETAALVDLWLGHMDADFGAIEDLACAPRAGRAPSPAQRTPAEREAEIACWEALGIETRSYATRAPRLEADDGDVHRAAWSYLDPWLMGSIAVHALPGAAPDLLHHVCYRACEGGPFTACVDDSVRRAAGLLDLSDRDNDGIVNTASMLWPDGTRTELVAADHMDIVGHYVTRASAGDGRRRHDSYDLLGSEAGFCAAAFADVWDGIFDFCAPS